MGNPDLLDRGLVTVLVPFLLRLVYPNFSNCLGTGPCPNHRLSAVGLSFVLVTYDYELNDVNPAKLMLSIGTHLAGAAGLWMTVMIDCSDRLLMMSNSDRRLRCEFRSGQAQESTS